MMGFSPHTRIPDGAQLVRELTGTVEGTGERAVIGVYSAYCAGRLTRWFNIFWPDRPRGRRLFRRRFTGRNLPKVEEWWRDNAAILIPVKE